MDPTVEEGVGVMALEHPVPQRPVFNGNSAVQSGERNTRHKAGDLQLHDAEGQHPDQPQQAPQQFRIWPRR